MELCYKSISKYIWKQPTYFLVRVKLCSTLCDPMDSPDSFSEQWEAMGFPRKEHWSGFPCSLPGYFPDPPSQWHPTPVLLPGKSYGWRSLVGSLRVHGVAKSRTRLREFTFTYWRRKWQPTSVFLPGKSYGWRSLVGYSPRGCEESDTKRLHFHFQGILE